MYMRYNTEKSGLCMLAIVISRERLLLCFKWTNLVENTKKKHSWSISFESYVLYRENINFEEWLFSLSMNYNWYIILRWIIFNLYFGWHRICISCNRWKWGGGNCNSCKYVNVFISSNTTVHLHVIFFLKNFLKDRIYLCLPLFTYMYIYK